MSTAGIVINNKILVGYAGQEKNVRIDDDIISIADNAFASNQIIERIEINSSTLRTIGEKAFFECQNLKSVHIKTLKGGLIDLALKGLPTQLSLSSAQSDAFIRILEEVRDGTNKRYFTPELTAEILAWKDERNTMIHALLKQNIHTGDLQDIAERGQALVRTLCSKVSSYNRALDRLAEKGKG